MALYNPGAGQTDWRKQLQQVKQPTAMSQGGQQAGLGSNYQTQPQARTATTTQPTGQSAVYNAAASPSAAALNPDNVNWGTQNPGAGGTAPNTSGSPANGYGYGSGAAYTAKDPRYGGAYNAENYKTPPTLYYEQGFQTDDRVDPIFFMSDNIAGDDYVANVFSQNAAAAQAGGWTPDTGMGMTRTMKDIYNTLGTLNVDSVDFYQGLKGSSGMDFASWAAANGLPADGGENYWAWKMFENWNNLSSNGTIRPGGTTNPNNMTPNPNDGKDPAMLDDPLKRNPKRNKREHKNNGGGGGGGNGGRGPNGPHGGSGYGPQGQQGPGGGRPNNGGGGNKNNNNKGGGNNKNNNKKK